MKKDKDFEICFKKVCNMSVYSVYKRCCRSHIDFIDFMKMICDDLGERYIIDMLNSIKANENKD